MRSRFLAIGLIAIAGFAALAAADDAPNADPFAVKLDVEERVLANGLHVLVAPRKCGPRVACAMWVRVGSVDEEPGKTGLAHVLEHMMFKGSHTIGVKDAALGEKIQAQQDAVWARKRAAEAKIQRGVAGDDPDDARPARLRSRERVRLACAKRLGIAVAALYAGDASDEDGTGAAIAAVTSEAKALAGYSAEGPYSDLFRELRAAEDEMAPLLLDERKNDRKEELWDLYVQAGGTNLNAYTTEDTTNYVVTLPSNKLELFFWLEADRLKDPVFREWYPEREVVKEERRIDENAPDGPFYEALSAVAYGPHPYGHPVLGWVKDLDNLTPADARDFFSKHYAPENVTCVLVGDLDPKTVFPMAERYLGKIPRRPCTPSIAPAEPTAPGEKRLVVEADTDARVEIWWKAPDPSSSDRDVLDVIAALLGGDTGRLYRDLVMDDGSATSTDAAQDIHRFPGRFHVSAKAKPDADLDALEDALDTEVAAIASADAPDLPVHAVTDDELERAKNRISADRVKTLEDLEGIAEQIGHASTVMGDWRAAIDHPARIRRVTLAQVRAVAAKYFKKAGRTVAVLHRKAAEPGDAGPPDQDTAPEARPPVGPRGDHKPGTGHKSGRGR
jgi:predicted Zn-dependent peptidase